MWFVPLGAATGTLIASDQHTMTSAIHLNTSEQKTANNVSTGSIVALGAIPGPLSPGASSTTLRRHTKQAYWQEKL